MNFDELEQRQREMRERVTKREREVERRPEPKPAVPKSRLRPDTWAGREREIEARMDREAAASLHVLRQVASRNFTLLEREKRISLGHPQSSWRGMMEAGLLCHPIRRTGKLAIMAYKWRGELSNQSRLFRPEA